MVRAAVVRGLGEVVAEPVRGAVEGPVDVGLRLRGAPIVVRLVSGGAPSARLVDPAMNNGRHVTIGAGIQRYSNSRPDGST